MLSEEEKKSCNEKLEVLNKEIKELKTEAQQLHKDKESWITKKNAVRQDISNIIKDVKELKEERNELTQKVQENKESREEVDSKIKELQSNIDSLKEKRNDAQSKLGLKKPINILQKEIKDMRDKVETIPMSFNAEKKLMQQIKDKEKQLKGADELISLQKELRAAINEFNKYKRFRDNSNYKVKSIASHSQSKHKSMIKEAEKIDLLREQEKEAHEKFKESKDKYTEINSKIKEKLSEIKEINSKLGIEQEEIKKKHDKVVKQSLNDKRKEVEEKMLKGEKLTTEDLLILQSE